MGTKIDHDRLYKIQTYSFHDAIITVTESCYGRTEIDKPAKPNKHGYTQSPTVHTDGTEHYYKYDHWEEAIAVVPLHFDYADKLTEADKVKTVLETVDALEKAYNSYPDGEINISWTMRRSCVNQD